MKTIIKIIAIAFAFVLGVAVCSGQSCTTATCNAATPNMSDVLAALPSPSNTNSTVVVNIPSGTSSWTSSLSYTVPSAVTNLTIQGNTTINWTGTPGTSSWAQSTTDSTSINDAYQNGGTCNPLMTFTVNGTGTKFRMTNLTIGGGNIVSGSNNKCAGLLSIRGSSRSIRLDHIHFNYRTYTPTNPGGAWVRFNDTALGVIDHSYCDNGPANMSTLMNCFQTYAPATDSIGEGDGPWSTATPWGSLNQLYIESNYILSGAATDCTNGASYVVRYNTFDTEYVAVQTHATKSTAGAERGCRSYEAYNNYFTGPSDGASYGDAPAGSKGGTAIVVNNTMFQGYYRFWTGSTDRNSNSQCEIYQPSGWSWCGSGVAGTSSCANPDVGASTWDGNSSSVTGYPCMDGLGRGQGDALNGANTITARRNTITGTQSWPHELLEPIYLAGNTICQSSNPACPTGGPHYGGNEVELRDISTQNNRDIYYECNTFSGNGCTTFNGTQGTGSGALSSRPSTCTAGPGGTFGGAPGGGSLGVGYYDTTNNQLDVCKSTNTWSVLWTPAVYPNPLVSGGGPTSFTLSVSAANGSVSGTNSAPGTYASGTTIGPLTATPNAGYHFVTWSTSGSASCSGTGTCGSFSLTSNTSITATFSLNSWLLSTSSTGTGLGTIICTPSGTIASGTSVSCAISANAGSTITTVSGCGGTWSASPYTFSMPNSNCTVTATFQGTIATPTFAPAGGAYTSTQNVGITTSTSGATLHYTSDGSTPTCSSTTYSTPIAVSSNTTLKAIGCASGYTDSSVAAAVYTFGCGDPSQLSPNFSGTYTVPPATLPMTVGFVSPTSGCAMHYTSDGSTPTCASTAYPGGDFTISVVGSYTYRVIACQSGYTSSNVIGGSWVVNNAGTVTVTLSGVQISGDSIQ